MLASLLQCSETVGEKGNVLVHLMSITFVSKLLRFVNNFYSCKWAASVKYIKSIVFGNIADHIADFGVTATEAITKLPFYSIFLFFPPTLLPTTCKCQHSIVGVGDQPSDQVL